MESVRDISLLYDKSAFNIPRNEVFLYDGIRDFPVGNYMFKVSNKNTKARCEICSKVRMKMSELRQWRRSCVFIEFIS